MWSYFIAPLLSLLPGRWRRALFGDAPVDWTRATMICGFAQFAICLGALIWWYFRVLYGALGQQMDTTIRAAQGVPAEGAAFAMGFAALVTFALHPVTWLLGYFTIEGVWRTLAAVLTEESRGTLPLAVVAWLLDGARRRGYEARVPLVADQVTRGAEQDPWNLRVASCRPKPEWKYPLTVRYAEQFFQVIGQAPTGATPQRPHVYLLRKPPAGEAYRGVREYDPEELLRAPEAEPNFLVKLLREKFERWQIARLPRVPDAIERSSGAEGWHLKIETCREMPDWTVGRTIAYEGQLYSIVGAYQATAARPFGFRLRRLEETEAARGIIEYWADKGEQVQKKKGGREIPGPSRVGSG